MVGEAVVVLVLRNPNQHVVAPGGVGVPGADVPEVVAEVAEVRRALK